MTDDSAAALARWLASPASTSLLTEARALLSASPADPLRAGSALRAAHPDLPPDRASAVLEQATLTARATAQYGLPAGLLLTRDGLEAGTRPEVAARRARLVAGSGARRVLDLTGGLGFDAAAFAAAGLAVTAVERDPAIAAFLTHNVPAATVIEGDATDPAVRDALLADLAPTDVVFVDPARRDPRGPRDRATGRARPERDPERWSPRWSEVAALSHPRVLAKVAPGFSPPPGWAAEWVSVDRTIVECALASWPLSPAGSGEEHAAVILAGDTTVRIAADPAVPLATATTWGAWLAEPDPAVLRAGALGVLARDEQYASIDPDSTWLTGDHASTNPALRCYLVVAELAGSARQQKRGLADLGVRRATVKSRDVDADPRRTLRELGLSEGPEHVLVMTRRAGRIVSLVTQPAAARDR